MSQEPGGSTRTDRWLVGLVVAAIAAYVVLNAAAVWGPASRILEALTP